MSKISENIRTNIQTIIEEQNEIVMERWEVINGIWAARIGQLHVIVFGPGGTAKTFLAHSTHGHISDAVTFETMLDESSVPDQVFGGVDVAALVANGRSRRIVTGRLPEATDGFIDEVMNANKMMKHSLQSIMNERTFDNDGIMEVPLRQLLAGTNHNDCDTDPILAPFFDRFHLRFTVGYLQTRDNRFNMVTQAISRMAAIGRGTGTHHLGTKTQVSLADLDVAHAEALSLDVDDAVMGLYDDIWQELKGEGIILSDRRYVEGMVAVLSNAWLRGHTSVQSGDLDVLQSMWWSLQEHAGEAKGIILAATNPGEKAALDLLDELDKLKAELAKVNDSGQDDLVKRKVGVEQVRNADKLIREAQGFLAKSKAAGMSTARLEDTIARAEDFKVKVGASIFGLDASTLSV